METRKEIIKAYSDNLLLEKKSFNSIYELCLTIDIEESEFYKYYTNFESLEKDILKSMVEDSLELLKKSNEYETYNSKNKLLSFYFTFFEMLTLNRSLVLKLIHSEKNKIERLKKLDTFRIPFLEFVRELNINLLEVDSDNIQKIQEKTVDFSAWTQLLITIKFWIEDKSKGFEKTDIFIEKSIHTGFTLLENNTIKSFIDLGKFVWKEKFVKNKI